MPAPSKAPRSCHMRGMHLFISYLANSRRRSYASCIAFDSLVRRFIESPCKTLVYHIVPGGMFCCLNWKTFSMLHKHHQGQRSGLITDERQLFGRIYNRRYCSSNIACGMQGRGHAALNARKTTLTCQRVCRCVSELKTPCLALMPPWDLCHSPATALI